MKQTCPFRNCNGEVGINEINCPTCGRSHPDPPNVRMAKLPDEVAELENRYHQAWLYARASGTDSNLDQLEALLYNSEAVINANLDFVRLLVNSDKPMYSPYAMQVQGRSRRAALFENDQIRRTVETKMYGSVADQIIYAALSANGKGPASYGAFSMVLDPASISHRASVLEENSYHFMDAHEVRIMDKALPVGYRSTWEERKRLGVAKLGKKVTSEDDKESLYRKILSSEGNFETDNFMEVHIFGTFNRKAISRISGSYKDDLKTKKAINILKEKSEEAGIEWED